jgi:Domain of unknown function (DUF1848)
MLNIISASRRTDLIAYFPQYLRDSIIAKKAHVVGPYGRLYDVDLNPEHVHTFVLWSKDYSNLIENRMQLKELLAIYEQLYLLFTITGLGGTLIEPKVPPARDALAQLDNLISITGSPHRIGLRIDPIVVYTKDGNIQSNIKEFKKIAQTAHQKGIKRIIFSIMSIYAKCIKRSRKAGVEWVKPADQLLSDILKELAETANLLGVALLNCCNPELLHHHFIQKSSCIDGELLQLLHPAKKEIDSIKDHGQREECGCSISIDIGSYAQACPHACLYCYANPQRGQSPILKK